MYPKTPESLGERNSQGLLISAASRLLRSWKTRPGHTEMVNPRHAGGARRASAVVRGRAELVVLLPLLGWFPQMWEREAQRD